MQKLFLNPVLALFQGLLSLLLRLLSMGFLSEIKFLILRTPLLLSLTCCNESPKSWRGENYKVRGFLALDWELMAGTRC